MGILLISNSNGTHYSSSLEYTNRESGYNDFSRMEGIRGTLLANRVHIFS